MQTGTFQVKRVSASVNRSTTLSPPANTKSRKSPSRIDAVRNRSKGAAASGCSAARLLHSHNIIGSLRKATGQSEEVSQQGEGGKSTIGCSGATHTAGEKDVGAGVNRRHSASSMRSDLRVKADQIKFDQVKFDSAKFGHQVSSGSKPGFHWTANLSNSPHRTMVTGSLTESSSRIQSITTKSTTSSVAEPAKQIGHASVTSSTGHAPVITSKQTQQLAASASGTAGRAAQSSVVVVLTKNNRREEGAAVSSSDSIVRPSAGVFHLLNTASKVHASPSNDDWRPSTIPSSTFAGHGLQTPEVYGKVCRKESGSGETPEAGSFQQICASASYTLEMDRLRGQRSGEHSREPEGAAGHLPPHCDASCKPKTVTREVESVSGQLYNHQSVSRGVKSGQETLNGEVDNVVTEPENATSEPEQVIKDVDFPGRESGLEEAGAKLPEDKAIVCNSSSSLACPSPEDPTEYQKNRITDSAESEAAGEVGGSMKVRFTKPVCVNETLAVDHFRFRLAEEKAMTSILKQQMGALRKDLTKSRTDLLREEELRQRAEEWAEYLELELESYVRSRTEAEEKYLNLLQVVRGIDHFTKQLLHKYVTLHRKVETSFERLECDCPPKTNLSLKAQCSAAAAAREEQVQDDPKAMTEEAAEPKGKRPPLNPADYQPDLLFDDDYDFIAKYLRASSCLPETNAEVHNEGLLPDADECDTEANWSSNNFVSFRDVSSSFDETGRTEEQDKSIHVQESENISTENDVECAGDNKKPKTFDVRLRRLSKFFDQVISICYTKPETYFRVLEDGSCCLADETRLSVGKGRRGKFRSGKQRSCQDEDFTLQVRSYGAGDIASGGHVEREKGNGRQEHDSEGESNRQQEDEEEKLEEGEEVGEIDEEEKHEEKTGKSKLNSMSVELPDQVVGAILSSVATQTEAEKTTTPSHKKDCDRPPEAETNDKGHEKEASRAVGDEEGVAPSGVQREYLNRLLKEMCYYCDRYRPGDRAAGLKAFLRDTIEAEFLSKQ